MRLVKALRKWRSLDKKHRLYWIKAAFSLIVIGMGLRVLSFSTFKSWYLKVNSKLAGKAAPDHDIPTIVWAVESAARLLPLRLLCLPQSLATKFLLGQSEGVVMHIGVNKEKLKGFEFHAWVEKRGKTIIGDLPTQYHPLWVWD